MQGMQSTEQIISKETLVDPSDELFVGLNRPNKRIDQKFHYNEYGSALFGKITALPEYYLTRTESLLLQRHSEEIAQYMGAGQMLIEHGAGNCGKVRHLLAPLQPQCYVPIDISAEFLFQSACHLQQDFSELYIHPIAGDITTSSQLPEHYRKLKKCVLYLGSSIANYPPEQAITILRQIHQLIAPSGGLLIGVDLQKDTSILQQAYNDEQGLVADFNLNALQHANELLDGNFDQDLFDHVAFYNEDKQRIEMHLQSSVDHEVELLGQTIPIRAGERIQTLQSYKYTVESFAALAQQAGLIPVKQWIDEQQLYSLQYFSSPQSPESTR
ncbi:dimethylhistidine N-methyltransferase [Sinobacterium caligoides]|uniref:Dimethylhistidine N-methyltransferase n=1 Tax=Sinobacterium caligoides TaxID=933926 RepID=A0A3N2DJZ9_9GAMM|nr:L-histidine N(alpha)-methyltransferase [Sinobacterium caligoides]ROS00134.1 dimethylhistidine N-methyltransferase [Sinobacterium caligoides]